MSVQTAESWIPDINSFASRLILVRHIMGWNQKEAALACGIAQGSWRQWETLGSLPRDFQGTIAKISERTQVDDYWLMTGKTPPLGSDGVPGVRAKGFEPPTFCSVVSLSDRRAA